MKNDRYVDKNLTSSGVLFHSYILKLSFFYSDVIYLKLICDPLEHVKSAPCKQVFLSLFFRQ